MSKVHYGQNSRNLCCPEVDGIDEMADHAEDVTCINCIQDMIQVAKNYLGAWTARRAEIEEREDGASSVLTPELLLESKNLLNVNYHTLTHDEMIEALEQMRDRGGYSPPKIVSWTEYQRIKKEESNESN